MLHAKTDYIFNEEVQTHSISSEQTFETDLVNTKAIEDILFQLSMEVSARLLTEKVTSSTAFIKIRYYDFKTYTMQEAGSPITNAQELFFRAKNLFYRKYESGKPIRLLGIGVMKVVAEQNVTQVELFESVEQQHAEKQKRVEQAALRISEKIGKQSLTRARLLKRKQDDKK